MENLGLREIVANGFGRCLDIRTPMAPLITPTTQFRGAEGVLMQWHNVLHSTPRRSPAKSVKSSFFGVVKGFVFLTIHSTPSMLSLIFHLPYFVADCAPRLVDHNHTQQSQPKGEELQCGLNQCHNNGQRVVAKTPPNPGDVHDCAIIVGQHCHVHLSHKSHTPKRHTHPRTRAWTVVFVCHLQA